MHLCISLPTEDWVWALKYPKWQLSHRDSLHQGPAITCNRRLSVPHSETKETMPLWSPWTFPNSERDQNLPIFHFVEFKKTRHSHMRQISNSPPGFPHGLILSPVLSTDQKRGRPALAFPGDLPQNPRHHSHPAAH